MRREQFLGLVCSLALLTCVATTTRASHLTTFGAVDAIDHTFGPGGGSFSGTLSSASDDDWIVFNATTGDTITVAYSTNINFMDGAVFREVTNGIVEVGDIAGVTNFNSDRTGAGTDLVVQHGPLLGGNYVFGTSSGGTQTMNLSITTTGQYAIGVSVNNEDASRTGGYTVRLSGNTSAAVPEPSSLALLGIGGAALAFFGVRRRRKR